MTPKTQKIILWIIATPILILAVSNDKILSALFWLMIAGMIHQFINKRSTGNNRIKTKHKK